MTNQVGKNSQSVSEREWSKSKDWSYSYAPIVELSKKTLGLVGFGKIGQKVGEIANAFGMNVIYYNPSERTGFGKKVSLEQLFRQSDIVSLHLPLKSDNSAFVNRSLLSLMKPTSFLINTSRGQLINEIDLAEALNKRTIAGAALDVLSHEPPPSDHPLIGLLNCIITPHNAWLSIEARQRILDMTLKNIRSVLKGSPQNVVNI